MEFDGTEYNKEHFEKPTVTPERLAEIIDNLEDDYYSKGYAFGDLSLGDFITAELLKTLDIREKDHDYITEYYTDRKRDHKTSGK